MSDTPDYLKRGDGLILLLHAAIQPMARRLIANASEAYTTLAITTGLRLGSEQARLYAQGRTTPGAIVTHSPPGYSWHEFGLAFDVAVLDNGKLTYPEDETLWQLVGELGESYGLTWGGRFEHFKDRPHFEFHPGLTIDDARKGMRPDAPVEPESQ